MSNILDGLLNRIDDAELRRAISGEVAGLRDTKDFGLVFERHTPETVVLPNHTVRRGSSVQESDGDGSIWTVRRIKSGEAQLLGAEGAEKNAPVEDLEVVRRMGEPIFPGLTSVGTVALGGDKPPHLVIKGENYHVLEALQYTYEGQIDCIYIDPPYNSGARDWKYDNDYVDENDRYRHSKWLAFMERRLLLAKQLLNHENSVLIVTIDEKEYLRLGMLLEQVFPEARIQMVSSVIKAGGVSRVGAFGRSDEYLYFVQMGESAARPAVLGAEWNPVRTDNKYKLRWKNGMRSGEGAKRSDSPNLFFPVFVRNTDEGPEFDSVGQTFVGDDRSAVVVPEGCSAVWPIRASGEEGRWMMSSATLRQLIQAGHARLGDWKEGRTALYYLARGERQKVESGVFTVTGRRADGSVVVDENTYVPKFLPTTQWNIMSHDAGYGGSRLLRSLIPGRQFPFPKSLYAVEDALRFFVADKPDALILDFFGGSGTTTHAVSRLNRQDGGRRRSIVVTNNEVSDDEAKALRKDGHRPGDPEWETLGIFEHVTRPRITAAVTGQTHEGTSVKGDYKVTDERPMADGFEENVEFLELTYLDRDAISRGKSFEAIAHLLWMKAGGRGSAIAKTTKKFAAPKDATYAVLFAVEHIDEFAEAIEGRDDLAHIFVVTDSDAHYQQAVEALPREMPTTKLYDDFLRNFEITVGGAS